MEHIILHLRAWADDVDVDDEKVKSIGQLPVHSCILMA